MFVTIQLDLTKIGSLKELYKKVQFKDGMHQLLDIVVASTNEPDKYGNDLYVSCKPKGAPSDSKYYIGKGKDRTQGTSAPSTQTHTANTESDDDLPF